MKLSRSIQRSKLRRRPNGRRCGALTFVELIVVMVVLAVLAGLLVPLVGGVIGDSQRKATEATMQTVRAAIVGDARGSGHGYWSDMQQLPRPGEPGLNAGRADHPQLHYLFVNPEPETTFDPHTRLGWRGPYLQPTGATYQVDSARGFDTTYGEEGDAAVRDGWNRPIVIDQPGDERTASLRSAGPDGTLGTDDDIELPLFEEAP